MLIFVSATATNAHQAYIFLGSSFISTLHNLHSNTLQNCCFLALGDDRFGNEDVQFDAEMPNCIWTAYSLTRKLYMYDQRIQSLMR